MRPSVVILAGPNGAGKSTVAPALLHGALAVDEFVRRRYDAGLRNFFSLYEPLASTWRLYNASGPKPKLVAERLESQPLRVYHEAVWAVVKRQGTA